MTTPSDSTPSPQSEAKVRGEGFLFQLHGTLNQSYRVEHTTNLVQWTPLGNLRLLLSPQEILDTAATNLPLRLYRARELP